MRPDPKSIIQSGATVSDNIRALDRAGYKRSEIAALLGKRYQHVRNVLVDDKVHGRGAGAAAQGGVAESSNPFEGVGAMTDRIESNSLWLDVDADGRLTLPPPLREALGVAGGGRFRAARNADGVWELSTVQDAIKQLQGMFRSLGDPNVSWVDQLIAERRAEAERESRDD
jgi:bifunctional DNA-binding transcriptional regulator/antitoxin component of YhaV-PrlF toxin-antitoxin module